MSRIINDEQLKTFIILLRSDIDRLDEYITDRELSDEDRQCLIEDRDKLVKMCLDLGGESC